MRCLFHCVVSTCFAMMAACLGVEARAGTVPITFTASGGGTINSDPAFSTPGFTGTIAVAPTPGTNHPGEAILAPTGGMVSPITIATFTESTTAVGPGQSVYFDSTVNVPVAITDSGSGQEGTFTVTLSFTGFGANNFPVVTPILSVAPSTLDLGSYDYNVYYLATTSTGSNTASVQIGLQAIPLAVPEPGSLVLGSMGGLWMVLAVARRRQRNA